MQRKFKVGDKVKVVAGSHPIGVILKVREVVPDDDYGIIYYLSDSNKESSVIPFYKSHCIVHYQIRNTALARKMYPNHKVIDEDWICPNSK